MKRKGASLALVAVTLVGCGSSVDGGDVTPRDRLCLVEGWASEYYRFQSFPLEGVELSFDKDIGLPERTVRTDAKGRALWWDAKCGSRPYTVTARDASGRELTMRATQPADLGPSRAGLPPKFRHFSLGGSFTFPLSATTLKSQTVDIAAYQTSETGSLVDLVSFPASVGKEVSVVVQYELFPENALLEVNGERVHPRLFGEPPSGRDPRGAHEYRYLPSSRGKHDVRLISYYGDIALKHEIAFRAE